MAISVKLAARLTDAEILDLSERNPGLQIEQGVSEELILTPTGARANLREVALCVQLHRWAEADGRGLVFSPSTGFRLPDGSLLSPDAAWVCRDRWEALSHEQREGFAPVCPDAAFEILSHDDLFHRLRPKMRTYLANGARLAVLIDPERRTVEVHTPDRDPQLLESPESASFGPPLPGFTLNLKPIFEP